jgi:hypothetical protein
MVGVLAILRDAVAADDASRTDCTFKIGDQ